MTQQRAYLMDCMIALKETPDKFYDLCVCDPPYGINMDGGKIGGDNKGRTTDYIKKTWDKKAQEDEYFVELIRVSKNQIVFGANHFISHIPFDSPCWIVWDKDNTGNFADCELAWTSFKSAVRKYEFRWNGMLQGNMANKEIRIHPTQKPVALYEWILKNYAKVGNKILDTHLGSGSSRIAAYNMDFDFTGYEKDKDYFEAQEQRFKCHTAQLRIFDTVEPIEKQTTFDFS